MTGQAESAPEAEGLADLASFLDTPETETDEENEPETSEESTADSDTETEENDEQDDEEGDEPDEEPAPVAKITFKVKGEDGSDETIEATPEELASSYMRQADYTKKTQALAERESQAVQFLKTKHDEVRQQYLSQAELARAAVAQMAGLKTGDEMAQLAHSDPAAWVAENQRQQSIGNYLSGLDQQINTERQRAAQEAQAHQQQSLKQQYAQSWEVLQQEKIDKPALAKIYENTSKSYGFTQDELNNVYDHRLVKMMRDAAAFKDLQAKKPEVTRKAEAAPRVPVKQSTAQTRKDQELNNKFKAGRAKLNDLAALLR
jgi:hypothetical protein